MKNVLVLGGAGFIGSALCKVLLMNDYEVTVLDNLSLQVHGDRPDQTSPLYQSIKGKVNFHLGSVTSEADLAKALLNQDIIVHLAAETGTGQSMYKVKHYTDVNVGGTALMLDLLANSRHHVRKIVVASSRAVYGEGRYRSEELDAFVYPGQRSDTDMHKGDFEVKYPGCRLPLQLVATDEDSKMHPTSVYGLTKLSQEQLLMTVCPGIGIAPVAFRYQNVYGPGQSLSNPYTGILSIFSTLIQTGKPINIFEDGKESRDFVFIDDVITATYQGIVNDAANNVVFNVGTGIPTDVLTVAQALVRCYNREAPVVVTGNYRVGDIRHNYADLDRIRKTLGFSPQTTFDQGIRKFADWVITQEVKQGRYEESIQELKDKGLLK